MYTKMDYFDWDRKYKPISVDGCAKMFETYGEDLKEVVAADPNKVWTLVDGEDGETVIVNGYHFVNRIVYYITEVPFEDGEEIDVIDEDDIEEDYEDVL